MIISAKPYPNISKLSSQGGQFNTDNMSFFLLGRDALLSVIVNLGLKKGDSIIIPAYICDSAIKPLKAYGFNLVFIDIGRDLSLSVDDIKKVIENNQIKALLAVHYFGLTQYFDKVIDVCRESGIKVIEDASHSFMSQFLRNNDTIKCDAEVFSMRKSLPVVDGGALRINHGGYDEANKSDYQCASKVNDVTYLILRLLEKIVTRFGVNIYGQSVNNIKNKLRIKDSKKTCSVNAKSCRASWQLSNYLSNEKYLKSTQQIIVNNFQQLSQALRRLGFGLLVESIKEDVVPQACIIYDDEGGLVEYLRSKGVGAWRWPDQEMPQEVIQNPDHFSNAIFLNNNLVLIPIHQSLNVKKINQIINVLSAWKINNF